MLGSRMSQHSFAQIPSVNIPRSKFNRSSQAKDTWNFDYINPIYVDEVIPGDTHNVRLNLFARLATQKVPIMDNMYIDVFWFFVPNRILQSNWEKLNGAQDNPGDSIAYATPYMDAPTSTPTGFPVGSIYDKMGLPTGIATLHVGNTLPLRAYNKIWNDWFRDQNLQNSVLENVDDGPDAYADYTLLKRGKMHDYFTACLPNPQKGTTPVSLPLGTSAPVVLGFGAGNAPWLVKDASTHGVASGTLTGQAATGVLYNGTIGLVMDPQDTLTADLSSATAATINDLRLAFMTQSLLELDARGGTRYVEILRAHFGVISPDFRLQRPEFLGGGTIRINSHPVPQTAPQQGSGVVTPQGNLAAFATASGGAGFSKSFVEHGYILGLACARADITYQQGLERMWSKSTRYDFYWPKLQELGEQAVLLKEIYAQGPGGGSADASVFGYQERYAEYRYKPSQIRGEFRSTYSAPLDYWHMAEKFTTAPALNATFIVQNTPVARALQVTNDVHLIVDMYFNCISARPMLTYSVPATIGRF